MVERDKVAKLLHEVSQQQRWYDADDKEAERLAQGVLEIVSAYPQHVEGILGSLIGCLARGQKDALRTVIVVGKRTFASRGELKGECRTLLQRYPEGSHLEPFDAALLRELLAHHPRGAEKVRGIQAISCGKHPLYDSTCFFVVRNNGKEDFSYVRCIENMPTSENASQDRVCEVLCAVLQLHPASLEICARAIENHFPAHVGSTSVERYRNYVRSILFLCIRFTALTEYLLTILIRQMVKVDVEMTNQEDEDESAIPDDKLDQAAQILDTMMMLVFEFLQRRLLVSAPGGAGVVENQLVATLFQIFENVVLSTHRTRHVQFLFFYIASLRPAWTEAFLTVLLRFMYAPETSITKRLIAIAYLASFLARASFLTTRYSHRTTQYMSAFAREHLQTVENLEGFSQSRGASASTHPQSVLFYATVQAVCYILCFKAETFAAEADSTGQSMLSALLPVGGALVGKEAFTPVLASACCPLDNISVHIAKQFRRCVRTHCPEVQHELQTRRPRGTSLEDISESLPNLDVFFPFDPYRLRHSHMYIKNIYAMWSGAEQAEDSDTDGDEEAKEGEPAVVSGGFGQSAEATKRRLASSEGAETPGSDPDDYADPGPNAAERGFKPSCGPSPMFKPQRIAAASEDMLMSPMITMMEGLDDDDGFEALPRASVDVGVPYGEGGTNAFLNSMLNTPGYVAG